MTRLAFRIFMLFPIGYLGYLALVGQLGAEPVKELNHKAGEFALYLILFNLTIGICRDLFKPSAPWFRFFWLERRYLGVLSFLFLSAHVFFYFALEAFELQALQQIYTKTYLIFGSLAFLILFSLALTSTDWAIRQLSKRWKQLHRFVYLAAFLFSVHIMLIEKADLIFFGSILFIYWLAQLIRFFRRYKGRKATSLSH